MLTFNGRVSVFKMQPVFLISFFLHTETWCIYKCILRWLEMLQWRGQIFFFTAFPLMYKSTLGYLISIEPKEIALAVELHVCSLLCFFCSSLRSDAIDRSIILPSAQTSATLWDKSNCHVLIITAATTALYILFCWLMLVFINCPLIGFVLLTPNNVCYFKCNKKGNTLRLCNKL